MTLLVDPFHRIELMKAKREATRLWNMKSRQRIAFGEKQRLVRIAGLRKSIRKMDEAKEIEVSSSLRKELTYWEKVDPVKVWQQFLDAAKLDVTLRTKATKAVIEREQD